MTKKEYDLLDPSTGALQILETCLADKIWNLLARENGFALRYLDLYFQEEPEKIWEAIEQLLDEERAYLTPAGKRINPVFP